MSTKPKILLLGEIDHAYEKWNSLTALGELIRPSSKNRRDFIQECRDGSLDGVVAAYRTAASDSITGRFDEELVAILPKSWTFLASCGAGYDTIVPEACALRVPPLRVANVPTAVDDATADTAVFLMLGALRNFGLSMDTVRQGTWRGQPPLPLGHDPQGKVLGILGMGGIGRNLSIKARIFGMRTIYHNRNPLESEKAGGAKYVSFDELLRESDVLSLNLPLNSSTRHIISLKELKKMKPTSIIVNTARGAVLDESALVEALDQGYIAGAGLDVFEEEPSIHPGLINNKKAILLPHMGTYTVETQKKMEEWAIENIKCALEEGRLKSPIPEHKNLIVL